MNKNMFRKFLPHIIAVLVFLVVAVIYCRPALEGKVVQQSDITQWKGSIHQSEVYKETHGRMPLWTNSMFAGMPAFQVGTDSGNFIPAIVHKIITLGLPEPIQFFFLACVCFYLLCIVGLRVNVFAAILGSLAFAYATYDPILIATGHNTKMWVIAYTPALLGSILLIYRKKYWIGAALTALFTATMIAMNHPQIAYYFFIATFIITIFYIIEWVKQKDWKHIGLALGFTAVAGLTGLLVNAENLFSTYEYQKETIRGGNSVLTDTTKKHTTPQTGLDKDYAFSYSAAITEPLVMMFPRMLGGSSGNSEVNEDKSKAMESLQQTGQQTLQQIGQQTGIYLPQFLSYYWGGISQDGRFGGTSGPPYSGAIICFLAILSFFIIDNKLKWGALAAILFFIVLSWGSYFKEFNYFIFDHFPFYNKFRAPSMALYVPQLLLPLLAVLGVHTFMNTTDKKTLLPKLKKGLIVTGGFFVLAFLLYFSYTFLTPGDREILNATKEQPQLHAIVKSFYDGLVADRKGLMMGDIFRSLAFIVAAAAILFLAIRNTIKPIVATVLLTLFVFIDLIVIDNIYLNSDNYLDKTENDSSFQKTKADEEILADKSYYRVYNVSGNAMTEAFTSYHYNSLGGYHAVKLRLYQDILEKQFSSRQPNMAVLNMLNTKYFIQKDQKGLTQQYQKNETALGPCWLVKDVVFVKNADAEMEALNNFNPKDTAFVQEAFKSSVPFMPVADSTASVTLVKNDNDLITYEFNAATNQFAVFSEVYYTAGWKAFIDGKEAPIVKTNYILRGLAVTAGKHKIEFKFEPAGYLKGKKLTSIFSIILLVLVAAGVFLEWRNSKKQLPAKA